MLPVVQGTRVFGRRGFAQSESVEWRNGWPACRGTFTPAGEVERSSSKAPPHPSLTELFSCFLKESEPNLTCCLPLRLFDIDNFRQFSAFAFRCFSEPLHNLRVAGEH